MTETFSPYAIVRDVLAVVPTHDGRVLLVVRDPDSGREVAGITMPGTSAAWVAQELLDAAAMAVS